MKSKSFAFASALLIGTLVSQVAPSAHAAAPPFPDLVYTVSLNTSALTVNPNAPFSLDLQLVTGSGNAMTGAGNVPNTVMLSNFNFVGGTSAGTPDYTNGGETGSIANGIVLANSASDNEFAEVFSPGTTKITFQVDQTPNSEVASTGTPIPDQFNVAILDSSLANIPTTDPSTGNTLTSSPLGTSATYFGVKTFSSLSPDGGVTASVVPEPNQMGMLAAGVFALLGLIRFNQRRLS